MSRGLSFQSSDDQSSQNDHSMRNPGMSSRKFSARARRLEVLSYRQHFNDLWQRIISDSFETPADAALFFGVDPSTAENWFEGRNAPQGWGVAWLVSHPETREATLSALAGA